MFTKTILLLTALVALISASAKVPQGPTSNSDKIVGGTPAAPNEFPFYLRLLISDGSSTYLCGGSILNSNWAITAAHCVNLPQLQSVTLQAGLNSVSSPSPGSYSLQAERVVVHPNFDASRVINDLALIKVQEGGFRSTSGSQPIQLAAPGTQCSGTSTIMGFGTTTEEGSVSDILLKAQVEILSDATCSRDLGSTYQSCCMICAGFQPGQRPTDACQGDSGGPLVVYNGNVPRLCGLTSFGNGCARPNEPGVYTRVEAYNQWILQTIGSQ